MSLPNLSDQTSLPSFSVNPNDVGSTDATESQRDFIDRRNIADPESRGPERRQFGSSHAGLSDDGRELALAIDQYKIQHHRRYLTCDEMIRVLSSLGYSKQS